MLEPRDGKLSCVVLRGEWGREAPALPGAPGQSNEDTQIPAK